MIWWNLAWAIAWPSAWTALMRLWLRRWSWYQYGCGGFGVAVGGVTGMPSWQVAAGIAQMALAVFMWWFNKRRRDRAKAWLGAKSKALRDTLVRKQREATRPRPVLRPVPGGAR